MTISGYDPEDLDDVLENLLGEDEIADVLTENELTAYRNGDESLVDLLDSSEIERILDERDASAGTSE